MQYIPIPAFYDNYIWLIKEASHSMTACVDPGDASNLLDYLQKEQLQLSYILITHHHADHIGGIPTLLQYYPQAQVFGPKDERIQHVHHRLNENSHVQLPLLPCEFKVIETPGHTLSHICYYDEQNAALFCGDTLFSAGCGRLFEGSAKQMINSLAKLSALPNNTRVFCAHEYTLNNLKFAETLEPNNHAIQEMINALSPKQLSLPSAMEKEKKINPFLRCDSAALKQQVQQLGGNTQTKEDVFQFIRKLKDNF